MLNITQIPAPRVKLIDEKTGLMSREWFVFFNNIYTIVGANLGVVQIQNGGTGLGDFPTNGQLLIGNAGEYKLNTLGYGSGISVTNGAGSITVSNTGVLSNIASTGISVSEATGNVTITNTKPDQIVSLIGAGTTAITGTYPNFTVTSNDQYVGTVTSVSVVSSNGFAGTVATASTTPAITLSTTITGLLKGNGTAISAATSGADYLVPSAPVTKTADFTVAAGETWIINNKTGSTCTVTLPSASAVAGRQLNFQNYQDQLLVSASSNVVPRAGGTAGTAILDAVAGNWATLISNGTNWVVMQASPYNVLLT